MQPTKSIADRLWAGEAVRVTTGENTFTIQRWDLPHWNRRRRRFLLTPDGEAEPNAHQPMMSKGELEAWISLLKEVA